jgi:hypothetical protein
MFYTSLFFFKQAIYVGDVNDEVNIPNENLKYTIRLLPQRGGSSGGGGNDGRKVPTFLVVHVVIPKKYPHMTPVLNFGENKGLSSQEILELQGELNQMASSYVGQEMMYQLLSHAETFLYTHQKRSVGSFHDEMIMRQKQMEDFNMKKQIDLKEKERLAIKEEIIRKQNEEREELRKIKEQRRSQVNTSSVNADQAEDTSPTPSPNSSPVKGDVSAMATALRGRTTSKRRFSTGGKRNAMRSNSEESESSFSESSDLVLLEFCGKTGSNLFYRGEILGKSERGNFRQKLIKKERK